MYTLGFSPCPNDTYMFAALIHGWIDTGDLRFEVFMEDVETLNEWASVGKLDISKLSFHRALGLKRHYTLLQAGAALGNNCGPLLVAREGFDVQHIHQARVAVPGQWTTAHLLFTLFYPEAMGKLFMHFSSIEDAVLDGIADAGVIIHENRFTYQDKGLVKIRDLGEAWESQTGLPIPLGGIFAAHRIPGPTLPVLSHLIHESILYAREHPAQVMPYVRQFAQAMDDAVMQRHIDLYVNDFSLDLGKKGHEAISALEKVLR